MIKIRPIQAGDLEYAVENAVEPQPKVVKFDYSKIAGYTAILPDGEIMMVGGVSMLWEGVGEAWLFMTKNATAQHKSESYKIILDMLNQLIEENGLRRITANIRSDFPAGQSLVEHLGFDYEGCMEEHAIDKIDVYVYGRLIQ